MPKVGVRPAYARYLHTPWISLANVSQAFGTIARVYLTPIDIPHPCIVDKIIYQIGAAAAGNVRVGIYRRGSTADLPDGADLVRESASVAQAAASTTQLVTIADTLLVPAQYFIAIQSDATTGHFTVTYDVGQGFARYFDNVGGYGAFNTPCAVTTATPLLYWAALRVKTNLGF